MMFTPPQTQPGEVAVRDLYFSAYLRARGTTIVRTERDGRTMYWIYAIDDATYRTEQAAFTSGTGMVSAQAYAQAVVALKGMTFV